MGDTGKNSHVFYRAGVAKKYPLIVRGKGVYLYDDQGNKYMDIACGGAVCNIGYGNENIAEAIYKQTKTHNFAQTTSFTSEVQEYLAKEIIEMSPEGMEKVWFSSGGAESIETSIKMARQYHVEMGRPSKYIVISRWLSYHGHTLGALSVSGRTSWRKCYTPYLMNFPHIPPPNCYHCPFGKNHPSCNIDCALELEKIIKLIGDEHISAFLAETIGGGTSGVIIPVQEYWQLIREICDKHNILLILDEIMTGFGRTGKPFAIDHWGIVPEMISVAKGIGGSYAPLGGVICKKDIFDVFENGSGTFVHGYTYSGHPVACAAGLAVQKYLKKYNLIDRARELGDYFKKNLLRFLEIEIVGDVRGKGLFLAIEYVQDKKNRIPFDRKSKISERITAKAMENGLIVLPGTGGVDGELGDHNLIAPPFIISSEEIDQASEILEQSIRSIQNEL
jgi:adenosylmethionine-8-amino-7-oxononanoate aminotransferase